MAGGDYSGEALALAIGPGTGLVGAVALALLLTALALARPPSAGKATALPGDGRGGVEPVFRTDRFRRELRRADSRSRTPHRRLAVIRTRIGRFQTMGKIWNEDTRRQVAKRVTDVMHAGLRRDDTVRTIPGDGFVIVVEEARGSEAAGIARRLRRALASRSISGMGGPMRVTASFGVADRRAGESRDDARVGTESGRDAAIPDCEECVIMASEIEEILFLPPARTEQNPAAKAA